MNSVFVLMLVTATGVVEAPNTFTSLADCEKAMNRINGFQTYCIEKKPVNVEQEMGRFMSIFKNLQKEMLNEK